MSTDLPGAGAIDREHPWPGLDSFTEAMRPYFHGRDDEVAELARRVQRRLLTILFGQSGLGKTSLLRAGLVPRLRELGYCPVYVRIDYSAEAPTPSQQVKAAILAATRDAGAWTQPGVATQGESLWEFLHHRDDVLRNEAGKVLTPLLIFDQFEEVFTVAQGDADAQRRAAAFLGDLADLCENRAPAELEARMEADETLAERFDFTRSDYRVLIALREDYLAQLESLKVSMPSVTQNRMRIARMSGPQALAAVTGPGREIVSVEVAEAIVRFVAGAVELDEAEVEPALLSLVCRELNVARLAQGQAQISADVLAGSRDTILRDFYERTLADQPPRVRHFIEDELVTDSGYRESVAEERAQRAFAAAGAPQALDTLVDRRLLRIEERLDRRRVELTHDVLCSMVVASREQRREREALEKAEAQVAEQRAQARAAHKALVRARQIAAGSAALAILAIAGALFGYFSMKRAQHAEALASTTRQQAEAGRGEAEKLVSYLLDDFQRELRPIGRVDIVADLARRAIAYYDGLPADLHTPETTRNRALALVRYGSALSGQSKLSEADKVMTEAVTILQDLHAQGDASEATTVGLAQGLTARSRLAGDQGDFAGARTWARQAVDTLQPLVTHASPSVAAQRSYGDALMALGWSQGQISDAQEIVAGPERIATLEKAREAYRSIASSNTTDLAAADSFASASALAADASMQFGRSEEALRVGQEAVDAATRVLEHRAFDASALSARALANATLCVVYMIELDPRGGTAPCQASIEDEEALTRLDPRNAGAWNGVAMVSGNVGMSLWSMGDIDGARRVLLQGLDARTHLVEFGSLAGTLIGAAGTLVTVEAQAGNRAGAQRAVAELALLEEAALRSVPEGSNSRILLKASTAQMAAAMPWGFGDYAATQAAAAAIARSLRAIHPADDGEKVSVAIQLVAALDLEANAEIGAGNFAAAAATLAQARALRPLVPADRLDQRRLVAAESASAAWAAARLGKFDEARALIEPVLAFQRELARRNRSDVTQHLELANALFVAAQADAGKRDALLAEAAAVLARLPQPFAQTRDVSELRQRIAKSRAGVRKQ
jgi:hypothetical protein